MSQQKYPKAYEAYQQAVYRDGRNPTFWCSIGVLYYQINQYRDALDAYSRAIRLNPHISEVWYDLGTLVSLPIAILGVTVLTRLAVRILQQPDQ
jgi:general transcriptional corepressor CYC8